MTPRLYALYFSAMRDAQFRRMLEAVDGDPFPSADAPAPARVTVAIIYYGYMIAKYAEALKGVSIYA